MAEVLPGVPFVSTKGYTGHTLGAAGGIEAAFTVACLQRGEIPASIGFAKPDPELAATPVTENTAISGDFALSESLAFGGNNAVLIFGRGDS
jgi:3-oxoacyl-[acyl-carrier-protein] synthase-1/3-oxoacyl-[acyl-carrier-protein] synthase II